MHQRRHLCSITIIIIINSSRAKVNVFPISQYTDLKVTLFVQCIQLHFHSETVTLQQFKHGFSPVIVHRRCMHDRS